MPPVIPRTGSAAAERLINELRALINPVAADIRRRIPPSATEIPPFPPVKKSTPLEIWNGSVCVKIYPTKWHDKKRRKHYRSNTLIWYDAGKRFRQKLSSLELAKRRAEQIAGSISTGQTIRNQFSQADVASFLRCRELLSKIEVGRGVPTAPELAVSVYVELMQILDGRCPVAACKAWATQNPVGAIAKTVPDVVQEFFLKREIGDKWKRMLSQMLDRFSTAFPGLITDLQPRAVDTWLDSLCCSRSCSRRSDEAESCSRRREEADSGNIGLRTRRNYFNAVTGLVEFAKTRGYLLENWDQLKTVSNPRPPKVRVNLYTPEELVTLLFTAEKTAAGRKLIPLIAITAFAGVRHGEMNEEKVEALDWSDIDFEARSIYIGEGIAKKCDKESGDDRTVDMPDNLIAWLAPFAKPRGKICPLANTSNALCRLRAKAGIEGPKKNALRKSFISYRLALTRNIDAVADQAGNSAGIIRKNYKRTNTRLKDAAERWFKIMPTEADKLPLFAWAKEAG